MVEAHANARLEAFCDGVFAIALTLLIIDIRVPATEGISSTRELWRALQHLGPAVFAFLLSFAIILITWVNHHGALRLVNKSSASFIYANGFLLLTVVFIPFPTALLGAFVGTDHAAPAVVLYNAVLGIQAISWLLLSSAALRNHLTDSQRSTATMRKHKKNAYFAFAFYALLAVAAFWFPVSIAIVTTVSWIIWLALGIRIEQA
jgi:TMEM175 potassium channel family protein